MEADASAFLVKNGPAGELAVTIRRVLRGERVIDPDLAAAALHAGPNPLSAREREVLAAAGGSTVADNAERTGRRWRSSETRPRQEQICFQTSGSRPHPERSPTCRRAPRTRSRASEGSTPSWATSVA